MSAVCAKAGAMASMITMRIGNDEMRRILSLLIVVCS